MSKVRNGIRKKFGFPKNVDELNLLELNGKVLDVSDDHFEAPRNQAFIEDTVNDELGIAFHLNSNEMLAQH